MSGLDKTSEIQRLIEAFEKESAQFHDIEFRTHHVTQDESGGDREYVIPNHVIMLWQYYGAIHGNKEADQLGTDLVESNLKWGLRGAAISQFTVIEGDECKLFVRMASRAGSLFDEDKSTYLKSRVVAEIQAADKALNPTAKPVAAINSNPIAKWLNFLLYHLSLTTPAGEHASKIEPDVFSLSQLSLERLLVDQRVGKIDRSVRRLEDIRFKVAVSFPGEKRRYVSRVVNAPRESIGEDAIFHDHDYQAQLARPNLDVLLQKIYRDDSDLIVVFLCAEYATKQWCGLEWRAIRDIIKHKYDERVMFVRFDDAQIDGLFSIDGYIDGDSHTAKQVADFIAI